MIHSFRFLGVSSIVKSVAAVALSVVTFNSASATDFKVGGIMLVKPKYEGSEHYEVVGAPFAYPVFGNGGTGSFSINGLDDIRFRVIKRDGFEAGVLAGYTFGRDEEDGDLLRGLGDVDGGAIVGGFAGFRFAGTLFDVSYHRIVSGDTGGYVRFRVSDKRQVTARASVKVEAGATYADGDYMSVYFGVPAGLANAYDAEAGFKDVFVKASATYDIDDRWAVMGSVGYARLVGDAADSPIVETADQFSATLGLTYRFSFR